jgi:hypothetical protein
MIRDRQLRRPPPERTMRKIEMTVIGVIIVVACVLSFYGFPRRTMGFDNSWDCPPNATPASTVCVKR